MRIRNIHIEESKIFPTIGIKGIELTKLGQVVALVGKNGSGKSRILNTIADKKDYTFNEHSLRNQDISPIPSEFKDIINLQSDKLRYWEIYKKKLVPNIQAHDKKQIEVQLMNFYNGANINQKAHLTQQAEYTSKKLASIDSKIKNYIIKI